MLTLCVNFTGPQGAHVRLSITRGVSVKKTNIHTGGRSEQTPLHVGGPRPIR